MKKVGVVICLMCACMCIASRGAIEEQYKEDSITLSTSKGAKRGEGKIIVCGEKVTFSIRPHYSEFFGQSTISAGAEMTNSLPTKVKAVYAISFHDKDGTLVTCGQGSWDLKPGEQINYGSGILYATPEAIARITSYKLRTEVTESTKK